MSSAPVSVKSGYLPGIDGLRALPVFSDDDQDGLVAGFIFAVRLRK
jgi:hypothetical protein